MGGFGSVLVLTAPSHGRPFRLFSARSQGIWLFRSSTLQVLASWWRIE